MAWAPVPFLASSIEAASLLLRSEQLDFALLDVYVGVQNSLDFALSVRDANIPYVFATGYGEDLNVGPAHAPAWIVSKPFGRMELGSIIGKALGRRGGFTRDHQQLHDRGDTPEDGTRRR